MPILTEGTHAGEFIVSEANGNRSREAVTIVSGQNLVAGAVVGRITASGKYAELDPAAVDGSEVAAGVLFDAVDASTADANGVLVARDAEVNAGELVWKTGMTDPEIATATAELVTLGVISR